LRSVELLDLFEARALYGLDPSPERNSVDDYLNDVEKKMRGIYEGAWFTASPFFLITEARSRMRLLPSGTELVNLDDAEEIALPTGCKTEQLAVYRENALLLINRDLWEALDTRNRAALFVHEGIYRLDRATEAKNSIYARKVTGHLFAEFHFEPIMMGIPKDAQQCVISSKKRPELLVPHYNFYLFETPGKRHSVTLQFIGIGGKTPFARTYVETPLIESERGASMYAQLQSGFETHQGLSITWRSWDDLRKGKFMAYLPEEGTLEIQCSGGDPVAGLN
jgi:hypothetical protein